jgi:hypothetical protein
MNIEIEQKLSKNINCLFKIQKELEPKTNYNIISCVFFIKKELYKDLNIYIDGLTHIIQNILPTFRLRIYYDSSVKEILNKILNNFINIELYEYRIQLLSDGIYHKGVIGTFMRFLPLFNLEYHKVDKCIVFDIDNKINNFYNDILKYFYDNEIKIAYRSRFCYLNKRVLCTKNKYPLIASFIYQSIQLPLKIFSKFFEKLYIENDVKIIKKINKCGIENIYEYGIDEFFLNKYYIKYLKKKNISFILVLYNHIDIISGLKKFLKYYCNDKLYLIIKPIIINFLKLIKIDIDFDNTNILELLDQNKKLFESKLYNKFKYYNINDLKQYILFEINNNNNNKIKLLLDCILNNFNIDVNKINLAEIKNNTIKYIHLDIL